MRRLKQLNHFGSVLKEQHALMTADALCDMFDQALTGMTTITSPIEKWKEGLAEIAWRIQKASELAEGIARSFVKLQDGIFTPMDTEKFITLVRNGNTQEAARMMVDANPMFGAIQERVLYNLQHPVSFLGRTSRGLLDIGMTGEQVFADALLHPLRTEAEQAMLSAEYTETFENFVKTLNTATPEQINDVVASVIADGLTFKVWHSAHSAIRTGATAAGGGASSSSSGTGIVPRPDQPPATQRPTFDLRSKGKGKAVAPKVVAAQRARQQSGARPSSRSAPSEQMQRASSSSSSRPKKVEKPDTFRGTVEEPARRTPHVRSKGQATRVIDYAQFENLSHEIYNPSRAISNPQKLIEVVKRYEHLPGAATKDGPIGRLYRMGNGKTTYGTSNALGAVAELEAAVSIEAQGETIQAFGQKIHFGDLLFEIDIITDRAIYEIKSINWSKKIGDSAHKLKINLNNKAQYAQELGLKFEVYSHKAFSPEWKQWFTENNINFFEAK